MPINDQPLPLDTDCRTVKERLDAKDSFLLIDCREPEEHAMVHIAGAKLMPMSQIQSQLAELAPHKHDPIVVHCHHGGRSRRVTEWLRSQGFSLAQNMAGGIDQWAVEIDPKLPRY